MGEQEICPDRFKTIIQVLGVAYTYLPSLVVRRHLTEATTAYHSSKHSRFSYFYKGTPPSVVGDQQELHLRIDPATGVLAKHWPEPELAILLGSHHEIIAYTLANDLTAINIEARGRSEDVDNTYVGKVWNGSGSLGPQFISASAISNASNLMIGLKIIRRGHTIYDQRYSTSRCLRPFSAIPDEIVACYKQFNNHLPLSKQIMIDEEGFLPSGTVIMLGTGLIVQRKYFCEPGDRLIVYCSCIGELVNSVGTAFSA
jgi:fumarylacetoacetate (FAA) hydrolase family protein